MADGNDILRITDRQVLYGQTVLNVYFYQLQDTGEFGEGYLDSIALHFTEAVVTPVSAIQSPDIQHNEIYLENLTNGVDILTYADGYPLVGTNTGAALPPFVSAGFQLIRESRATRNGSKRIAGIREADVTNGLWVGDPDFITDIENGMAADLVEGLATLCHPIILRHPVTVPLVSPVFSNIGECQYRAIGSQNTRKLGRGV